MPSSIDSSPLTQLLAEALPKDVLFTFYHISTPPQQCPAIFASPSNAKAERTYCESHFLNVSVVAHNTEQLIFGLEVFIYTTKHLTTIFVSKADSTGYATELGLPKTQTSPLRSIATTFISYLSQRRERPRTRLVVSLFARAANQYLYPGSVDNGKKHVLDDRQLVKWWSRVLDPVLREYSAEDAEHAEDQTTAVAYLMVPGEDGIAHFLPPSVRADSTLRKRWKNGHPLREIATAPSAPPRCLIPHFPDDPKARFLDELDEEIPDAFGSQQKNCTPSKRNNGQWKSVKTLEQFWEMMAFRQECSSGRLVGFLWVVMTPTNAYQGSQDLPSHITPKQSPEAPVTSADSAPEATSASKAKKLRQRHKRLLSGAIISRIPQIKSKTAGYPVNTVPEKSEFYLWPADSRGEILLDAREYKRACDLLLRLDFANEVIASSSARRWIEEVGVLGGISGGNWGVNVKGRWLETPTADASKGDNITNMLTIKQKRKVDAEVPAPETHDGAANVLSADLLRKKAKVETAPPQPSDRVEVNVLSAGLVRKKAKA